MASAPGRAELGEKPSAAAQRLAVDPRAGGTCLLPGTRSLSTQFSVVTSNKGFTLLVVDTYQNESQTECQPVGSFDAAAPVWRLL